MFINKWKLKSFPRFSSLFISQAILREDYIFIFGWLKFVKKKKIPCGEFVNFDFNGNVRLIHHHHPLWK